jgi:hypothetical protein
LGTYNGNYYSSGDVSTWPQKVRLNGTDILFQGCNVVGIPSRINFNTLALETSPSDAVTITKKACGSTDQPYIDLISKSTQI